MPLDFVRLSKAIRDTCTAKGWLQEDLIARSGIGRTTIQRLWKGETQIKPGRRTQRDLEDCLGWERGTVARLLAGDDVVLPIDEGHAESETPDARGILPADDVDPIVLALGRLRVSKATRQALIERYLQEKRAVERQILRAGLEAERTAQGGEYEDGYSNTA